jgi:signal transduction histidine kinase
VSHSIPASGPAWTIPLASDGVEEQRPWYRRDWITMVAGLALIATANYLVFEIVLHVLGWHPTNPGTHLTYEARLLSGISATAAWVAWRAHASERELMDALARERAREAARSLEVWRTEQAEGLAAFARVLAHELRGPLHGLTLHAIVLQRAAQRLEAPGDAVVRPAADVIEGEARRMGALVDDYLAYAKTADVALVRDVVALDVVASEAVEARRVAFASRGVTVTVEAASPVPPVSGDRARLADAVERVLEHALAAAPPGGHVDVSLETEGGQVVLVVTDDGPGFADPKAVFRPFFTSGASWLGPGRSGFGFAVVRDIVRAHRGEIAARNVEGHGGARVEIRLPRGVVR